MCGILGAIGTNAQQMTERVVRAANLMSHRGPDDWGVYTDENAALGFRRLSIIDLSPAGHQPMVSQDGNTVLVFNGEIYNYLELRKELEPNFPFYSQTDSEALLNGYRAWGWEELLQRIDGMFAFAITGAAGSHRSRPGREEAALLRECCWTPAIRIHAELDPGIAPLQARDQPPGH
jgi:asparagine synthase (glutamine-hydrolysing)